MRRATSTKHWQVKDLQKKNVKISFVNKDGTEVKYEPLFFSGKDGISKLKTKYKEHCITEDEEQSETTIYDQNDGEVQDGDENNNTGDFTDYRKRKLSSKPH